MKKQDRVTRKIFREIVTQLNSHYHEDSNYIHLPGQNMFCAGQRRYMFTIFCHTSKAGNNVSR